MTGFPEPVYDRNTATLRLPEFLIHDGKDLHTLDVLYGLITEKPITEGSFEDEKRFNWLYGAGWGYVFSIGGNGDSSSNHAVCLMNMFPFAYTLFGACSKVPSEHESRDYFEGSEDVYLNEIIHSGKASTVQQIEGNFYGGGIPFEADETHPDYLEFCRAMQKIEGISVVPAYDHKALKVEVSKTTAEMLEQARATTNSNGIDIFTRQLEVYDTELKQRWEAATEQLQEFVKEHHYAVPEYVRELEERWNVKCSPNLIFI